jgi:hypothetical protein
MAWPMSAGGCRSVRHRQEMTIAEMLSDSIVQALMEADRVDPRALEASLLGLARKLKERDQSNRL